MATIKKVKKAQIGTRVSSDNTRIPKRNPVAEQKAKTNKAVNSFVSSGISNKRASDEWFNAHRDRVIDKGWDDIAEGLRKRSNEYDSTSKENFRKADSAKSSLKKILPEKKKGGKVAKAKTGKQMIKRKDGSVSQRGLWDNLRSKAAKNKATGTKPKAPTKSMLKQEKKIKAKSKK